MKKISTIGRFAASAAILLFILNGHTTAQLNSSASGSNGSLKNFLQGYLRDPIMGIDSTTKYAAATIDLRGDGVHETIVYLTGQNWCGSGGCVTLVLAPNGPKFKVVSRIMITRPPIRVLTTKTNGWRDLSVRIQGGGDIVAYEGKLSFNGKSYPISPSNNRAQKLKADVPGEIVIGEDAEMMPLY